ncbi:Protein ecm33 [Talaromyces islandicus]|uniref:Protein ecm33 n=1 Tax=Talaromyces islandicus TaxID=28573 RepID=A0A0U1LQ81_TALIS|nr:Protein ecm33 [Talaromyces islandicus]
MSASKLFISALMASGLAMVAADDTCSGGAKISSQSDADALGSCSTYTGDITISNQVQTPLTFNGIKKVTGDFTANGAVNITSISAPLLSEIGGHFSLISINALTSLSMPTLISVGDITFKALANLQGLDFTKGVNTAGSVSITNTGLTSLQGIELNSVGQLDLTANDYLTEVNVNNMKNISGPLTISNNNNKLTIDFPNLVTAKDMTFRNTSSISVPSLANLTGALGLYGNFISNFSAPNLTSCTDVGLDSNGHLETLSLPQLTTLSGGLAISNNGKLESIDLPKLSHVDGAIDLTGSFTNVSFPALKYVHGGFNAQSTANFSCDDIEAEKEAIHGSFNCTSTATPTTIDGSSGSNDTSGGSGTSSGSSGSATSSGAAVAGFVVPSMGLTAVLGGLLSLLM